MNQSNTFTNPAERAVGYNQNDNTTENISNISDSQFRDSLDTLFESFESQPSDFCMDEDGASALTSQPNNQQQSLFQNNYQQGFQNVQAADQNVRNGGIEYASLAAAYQQYVQSSQPALQFVGTGPTGTCNTNVFDNASSNNLSIPIAQTSSLLLSYGNQMLPPAGSSMFFPSYSVPTSLGQIQPISQFIFLGNQQSQGIPMQPAQMFQSSAAAVSSFQLADTSFNVGKQNTKRAVAETVGSSDIINESKRQRKIQTVGNKVLKEQDIAVTEDEGDQDKRRHDRNVREQMRSQRITYQINDLRELLKASQVPFKMDKFSTLVTVDQYIRELQDKSAVLDDEQKKLLATLTKTTEIVNNQYMPSQAPRKDPILFQPNDEINGSRCSGPSDDSSQVSNAFDQEDESISFVKGIDFKFIFDFCPVACSITSLDGRFLDCNEEFFSLTGFSRGEVIIHDTRLRGQVFDTSLTHQKSIKCDPSSVPIVTSTCGKLDSNEVDVNSLNSRPQSPGTVREFSHERNKSLFNVLHKDNIESLFCALSKMLKFRDESSENAVDTFVDTVKLCRKDDEEVSLYNI